MPPYRSPEDKVSRFELLTKLKAKVSSQRPVRFDGYYNFENLVHDTVDAIMDERKPPVQPEPVVKGDETVTRDELYAALKRLRYTSDLHADRIVTDVLSHRENYAEGDVVQDTDNTVWVRTLTGKWSRPGDAYFYADNAPKRPLTRLKPAS